MTPFGVVPRWRPYVEGEPMPPGMLYRLAESPERVFLVGTVDPAGGECGHCVGPWPYAGPGGKTPWEVSSVLLDHGLRVED